MCGAAAEQNWEFRANLAGTLCLADGCTSSMRIISKDGATNRRGCAFIAGVGLGMVLLVIGLALGLFGPVDTGKLTGMPILDNRT